VGARSVSFIGKVTICAMLAAGVGCGDDVVPVRDSGVADASDSATPLRVALPSLSWWDPITEEIIPPAQARSCPPEWRLVTEGDVDQCEPWPASGRQDCPADEAHFIGQPGCAQIGSPCPSGSFPADPTGEPVLYVDGGAAAMGDGTLAAPFATIRQALAAAPDGSIVALAKGTYSEEGIVIDRGITLLGACAGETRMQTVGVTLTIRGGGRVRDLAVGSETSYAIEVEAAARAIIVGVHVDGAVNRGISSQGVTNVNNTVIDGVQPGFESGFGLFVIDGQTSIRDSVIRDSARVGVFVQEAMVDAEGLSVHDIDGGGVVGTAAGLFVGSGARARFLKTVVEEVVRAGVVVQGLGADVLLMDSVVRDGLTQGLSGNGGHPLEVRGASQVTVTRSRLESAESFGVALLDGEGGGATTTFESVVVRCEGLGVGVGLESGRLDIRNGLVEGATIVGVRATGPVEANIENVLIRDVVPDPRNGHTGRGLTAQLDAVVDVRSTLIERVHELGIFVADATATLTDVVVRDVESNGTEISGRALSVELGGTATLERVQLERSRDVGLMAMELGTTVTGRDVSVLQVRPQACAETSCTDRPFGHGVGAYFGASVTLESFEIRDASLCGLHLAERGAIDLLRGVVAGAQIGACVQVDGYDLGRLTNEVDYRANELTLESTRLPVPDIER